jgi:hypothetical protein
MSDYRALTLLDTNYSTYERVLVQIILTIFGDIKNSTQYCCPWIDTIMDATAGIREIVTYLEPMQCALRALSLDFWTAFEKVSHYYLCHIIIEHGFDDTSAKILWAPYKNVTSRIDVNGFLTEKFPIECSI